MLKLTNSIAVEPVNWNDVKDNLIDILKIHPKFDWARQLLIQVLTGILKDHKAAFIHLFKLLEHNKNNPVIQCDVAIVYMTHFQNYVKAAEHFKKSIAANADYDKPHYHLAILYLAKLFEPDLAKKHYQIACELNSNYKSAELDELFEIDQEIH